MSFRDGRHARKGPRSTAIVLTLSFVVAFAAVAAAVIMRVGDSAGATSPPAPDAGISQPISQEGRLIAVSPNSVTAQGPDGVTRTYIVDSQTNGITATGSQMGSTASAFAVNDEVAIVGVTRGDTNIATVVAHREATGPNGPPMDYALP